MWEAIRNELKEISAEEKDGYVRITCDSGDLDMAALSIDDHDSQDSDVIHLRLNKYIIASLPAWSTYAQNMLTEFRVSVNRLGQSDIAHWPEKIRSDLLSVTAFASMLRSLCKHIDDLDSEVEDTVRSMRDLLAPKIIKMLVVPYDPLRKAAINIAISAVDDGSAAVLASIQSGLITTNVLKIFFSHKPSPLVPYDDADVDAEGSEDTVALATSDPASTALIRRKLALLVLKLVRAQCSHEDFVTAIDPLFTHVESFHPLASLSDVNVRREFVTLISHQDDVFVNTLADLQVIHAEFLKVIHPSPWIQFVIQEFDSIDLFLDFLRVVGYDHLVLLDLLMSNETEFLSYLLSLLKHVAAHWPAFIRSCKTAGAEHGSDVLELSGSCLVNMAELIESLNKENMFPYNAQPLIRRLHTVISLAKAEPVPPVEDE